MISGRTTCKNIHAGPREPSTLSALPRPFSLAALGLRPAGLVLCTRAGWWLWARVVRPFLLRKEPSGDVRLPALVSDLRLPDGLVLAHRNGRARTHQRRGEQFHALTEC